MGNAREKWETRYRQQQGEPIGAPSALVVRWASRLQPPILDLAGGRGRNALYLARRGLRCVVVEISLTALRDLAQIVRREHLPIDLIHADLENFPLPRDTFGTILNIRYLQRSLFPAMKEAVRRGGLVLVETYLIDQQALGHPRNPDHLLQRGELRAAFADFEILETEEGLLEDNGSAYLARLVARRPAT